MIICGKILSNIFLTGYNFLIQNSPDLPTGIFFPTWGGKNLRRPVSFSLGSEKCLPPLFLAKAEPHHCSFILRWNKHFLSKTQEMLGEKKIVLFCVAFFCYGYFFFDHSFHLRIDHHLFKCFFSFCCFGLIIIHAFSSSYFFCCKK